MCVVYPANKGRERTAKNLPSVNSAADMVFLPISDPQHKIYARYADRRLIELQGQSDTFPESYIVQVHGT
eukprot:560191-Amorphochlora_amoeboformis.AAC.1